MKFKDRIQFKQNFQHMEIRHHKYQPQL